MTHVIANYNLAGTSKLITHALRDDDETTYCGLKWSNLKGDWQETGGTNFSCKHCVKKFNAENALTEDEFQALFRFWG